MSGWNGTEDIRGLPKHAAEDHTDGTTGSGAIVLATSPTISAPTISGFTNATHDHEANNGGGRLSPASWMGGPSTALLALFDLAFWEARSEATSYAHGDAVGTLTDTSAAASNWTQGTAGNKGTWKSTGASGAQLPMGFPFLRLDGTDDYYSRAASISANAMTVIAVVRNYGGGTGYRCMFRTNNHLLMKTMGTNSWGYYSGADIAYGAAMPSDWAILVWRVNGTGYNNWDMMPDGRMLNTTTAGAALGGSTTLLGSNESAPTQLADVDVAAFAIASSALSTANIAAACAYFRNAYFTP